MMMTLLLANLFFSPAVAATPALSGDYQRPCYAIDDDYLTTELNVTGNKWTLQHIAYEDDKCGQAYLIYQVDYKVKSEEQNIDMTTVEVSYMSLSDEVSEALNMVSYCGISDWKKKEKRVVTGKLCDEFNAPKQGDMIYSIIKVQGNDLYLGTMSGTADGKTPETRYDQVDSLPLHKLR